MDAEDPQETIRMLQERLEHYETALDPHCCQECREGLREEHADLMDQVDEVWALVDGKPDDGTVGVDRIREALRDRPVKRT